MMVQPIGFQNTIPSQVMCLSIDVPTDKSYTFVIPVPSFRAADAIRSDIKVFNSIGDYGMSFFSHLEQTFTESLGGLPPAYVPSFQMPDSKSAVKFECTVAENLGHLLSMDARVIDPSNVHHIAETLAPYGQGFSFVVARSQPPQNHVSKPATADLKQLCSQLLAGSITETDFRTSALGAQQAETSLVPAMPFAIICPCVPFSGSETPQMWLPTRVMRDCRFAPTVELDLRLYAIGCDIVPNPAQLQLRHSSAWVTAGTNLSLAKYLRPERLPAVFRSIDWVKLRNSDFKTLRVKGTSPNVDVTCVTQSPHAQFVEWYAGDDAVFR